MPPIPTPWAAGGSALQSPHILFILVDQMLARMIRLTHYSHLKERINFQRVRV